MRIGCFRRSNSLCPSELGRPQDSVYGWPPDQFGRVSRGDVRQKCVPPCLWPAWKPSQTAEASSALLAASSPGQLGPLRHYWGSSQVWRRHSHQAHHGKAFPAVLAPQAAPTAALEDLYSSATSPCLPAASFPPPILHLRNSAPVPKCSSFPLDYLNFKIL